MARQLFWLSDEVVRLWDIERLDAQVRLSRRRRRLADGRQEIFGHAG